MTVTTKIPAAAVRSTETPNAVMTTLASPTIGGAADLALWRVQMEADANGPEHSFDSEQVWTVVEGGIRVMIDGDQAVLAAGDTIVIPAGTTRRITADGRFEALVAGRAGAVVDAAGRERHTPPWIA